MATVPDILRLPPELMLRISTDLTTIELGNFRLSCKQVETNLFESFAREFFTKRQFMIEHISLEALVGIANHKTLSPYLTEVIIGLDTLHYEAPAKFAVRNNISRDVFLETGRARDMLVEAFSKLPNLRSVGIRDYDGNGRFRDGEAARWRSYGWSFARDYDPRWGRNHAPPDTMLPLLLYALEKASVRPTNLEAFLRRSKMPDCSFDLSNLPANVAPVLSGLETILLSLQEEMPMRAQDSNQGHRHLKDFLQHTPCLTHLRLNFVQTVDLRAAASFLDWLGTPSGAASKPGEPIPIALGNLTTLDLGMLAVAPATLLQVVSKFSNLKSLSLWKVTLACNSGDSTDACHVWSKFLPKLGRAFSAPDNVDNVMVGFAAASSINYQEHIPVRFAGKTSIDQNGEKKYEDPEGKVSYRKRVGSSVQAWFDEIGEKAFVEDHSFPGSPEFTNTDQSNDDDEGFDTQAEDSEGSDE